MTGGQLGRKSFSHYQVDRRPQTALKVLHTQKEEWKQQSKCWPHFLCAGRCREFKSETEIIVDGGRWSELLIIVCHHRASNQTIEQNLCLFTCGHAWKLATISSRWTPASALPQGFQICGQDEANVSESDSGSEGTDGSRRRVDVLNVNTMQGERQTLSINSDFRLRTGGRGWQKKRRHDS